MRQRNERRVGATAPRLKSKMGRQGLIAGLGLVAVGVAFWAGSALESHLPSAHAAGGRFPLQFADRDNRSSNHSQANGGNGGSADDEATPAATFENVYSLVKEHYVDALPTENALSDGALRSLLAALNDPNATFLDSDANAIFTQEAQGRFAGVGAGLFVQTFDKDGYTDHKIVVVSPLPGSPAEKAGLKPHDVITRVNGKWVLGSDPFLKVNRIVQKLQDANKDSDTEEVQKESDRARRQESGGIGLFKAQMLLRGDAAIVREYRLSATAPLHLTVVREGSPAPLTITVTPGTTTVAPVTARPIPEGGGVSLKIAAFTEHTADEVSHALVSENSMLARGLVLDLRGNAGGAGDGSSALRSAVRVAALFLPSGSGSAPVFAVEQTAGGKSKTLPVMAPRAGAAGGPGFTTPRLAVLVDGATAGAAEALAAALADSGRATLVGGRTFGDAIVQTVYPLPDHRSAFTLVTGRLLSPKRVSWAGVGLTPKVALAPGASDAQIGDKFTAVWRQPAPNAVSAAAVAAKPHRGGGSGKTSSAAAAR